MVKNENDFVNETYDTVPIRLMYNAMKIIAKRMSIVMKSYKSRKINHEICQYFHVSESE